MSDPFHWAERVSRRDIRRLYESDAQGMLDVDLLDEVHYGIYARVCDMMEVREAQQTGRVTCRSCRAPLPKPYRMGTRAKSQVLKCESCGWVVTCGEFYDSYTGKSMLPGSVTDLFESYLERFPQARRPAEKLLLIDWLIHQFHVMQGVAGKPVGQNVIQGTADQVRELIETLAYGPGSAQGLSSPQEWHAIYYDPVRMFKKSHSHSEVQKIAARLGIEGRGRMPEDELIPEILRRAPELAGKPEER
ncbi:MAG: Rho termination factor N-terminal domain-containing protein [Anaerolineae bacterium]|nr:Rho termination factor N-terminal domain-containing protein [Anaerolineae bacterium]